MGALAVGLLLGKYGIDMPSGKEPVEANILANRFNVMSGQFAGKDFRVEGWVYGPPMHWWSILVNFVLKECEGLLCRFGLYDAVLATRVGFRQSYIISLVFWNHTTQIQGVSSLLLAS